MRNATGTEHEPGGTLPEGTLTFLFTDIEGSTKLLQALGESRYGEVLAQHHTILRDVLSGQNGIEVGTEGDAFFVVFAQVSDAVNAALYVQRRMQDNDWGPDTEVAVRMGIHTGEARRMGDRYVGIDVHRAARGSPAPPTDARSWCPGLQPNTSVHRRRSTLGSGLRIWAPPGSRIWSSPSISSS